MRHRYLWYLAVTAALFAFCSWIFFADLSTPLLTREAPAPEHVERAVDPAHAAPRETTAAKEQSIRGVLLVEDERREASIPRGSTVLGLMRALEREGRLSFTGREYLGLGFMVESIDGKRAADDWYWILYINGATSTRGVSQVVLNAGDVAVWRYEKSY